MKRQSAGEHMTPIKRWSLIEPQRAFTDEEWAEIMRGPDSCCGDHGDYCGYCFNCPELPPAYTLWDANRRVMRCPDETEKT